MGWAAMLWGGSAAPRATGSRSGEREAAPAAPRSPCPHRTKSSPAARRNGSSSSEGCAILPGARSARHRTWGTSRALPQPPAPTWERPRWGLCSPGSLGMGSVGTGRRGTGLASGCWRPQGCPGTPRAAGGPPPTSPLTQGIPYLRCLAGDAARRLRSACTLTPPETFASCCTQVHQ